MESPKQKRSFIGSIFNIRAWVDYDRIIAQTDSLTEKLKFFFLPRQQTYQEDFESAKNRFHLSEDDLQTKQKNLLQLVYSMLLVAFMVFAYFCYCVVHEFWLAAFVSFSASFVPLVLAFRYHFWYFQIRQRKLGCSFKEWLLFLFGGKRQ